jgi:hypothetical protein
MGEINLRGLNFLSIIMRESKKNSEGTKIKTKRQKA